MVSLVIALISVLSIALAQQSTCEWAIIQDDTAYILNLRPALGRTLTWFDAPYDYDYTPCVDGNICLNGQNEITGMTVQRDDDQQNPQCIVLAEWDPNVVPTYDVDSNQFTLSYANGADCFGSPRKFDAIWNCDPTVEFVVTGVVEPRTCEYEMFINSRYACPNRTTTTMSPTGDCVWTIDDNTLNLTDIAGKVYLGTNSNDDQQSFTISPCANNIACGLEQAAMSTIISNSNFQCLTYLAVWDEGVTEPTYNANGPTWEFVYTNGKGCDGKTMVYRIFWECNQFIGEAEITAAKEVAPNTCIFEIHIASRYAC